MSTMNEHCHQPAQEDFESSRRHILDINGLNAGVREDCAEYTVIDEKARNLEGLILVVVEGQLEFDDVQPRHY